MKKLIIASLTLTLLLQVQAQYDPEALTVLDAMSNKYKKVKSFKASFSQKLTNESAGLDETISGDIAVKGDMYVLDVAGQKIFNDGTDIYTFNAEVNEVTISTYDPEESEITLSNVYDLYKNGFKYALAEEKSNGDRLIELDPESRDKSYFKIRMTINAKDELKSFTVFERTGNKYVYSINSFTPANLADSYFTFDTSEYPNVEVIDFR
ncbi:Outer membrane lipoprotein-sorting protein [Ekhidna lutea]|uniref:Outer membrane lipoprotein-sorting protein n=1 Tax=Ekhidna lutea TaxID=447679 RepID=A0A239JYD0_EKHLU|nr:outer membrane lipoprotein carrier protein LolA [Ekhidna lutea]SNT10790.1 Outer membrane lipoprotein-sorting protein [Ekhidna lutea]